MGYFFLFVVLSVDVSSEWIVVDWVPTTVLLLYDGCLDRCQEVPGEWRDYVSRRQTITHCWGSLKKYKCLLPWIINQPPGENMLVLLASIPLAKTPLTRSVILWLCRGWVGLWGFLWWAPSAKRKDHHGVSSGWSSAWHRSNTGLSSTQYEQIPIILVVWTFWLTPFFFRSITFWRAYG